MGVYHILPEVTTGKMRTLGFFDRLVRRPARGAALFFLGGYAPVGRDPCVPPPGTHFSAGHAGPALRDGMLNRV